MSTTIRPTPPGCATACGTSPACQCGDNRWQLRRRQVARHDLKAPRWFECSSGLLWLTVDGDPRDFILAPGQRIEIAIAQPVVIFAFADSTLCSGALPAVQGAGRAPARVHRSWLSRFARGARGQGFARGARAEAPTVQLVAGSCGDAG